MTFRERVKGMGNMPTVIRVSRTSCRSHSYYIPGNDGVIPGSADPFLGFSAERVDPAGALEAYSTAETGITETALGLLFFISVPHGFETFFLCYLHEFSSILIDCFLFDIGHIIHSLGYHRISDGKYGNKKIHSTITRAPTGH